MRQGVVNDVWRASLGGRATRSQPRRRLIAGCRLLTRSPSRFRHGHRIALKESVKFIKDQLAVKTAVLGREVAALFLHTRREDSGYRRGCRSGLWSLSVYAKI